MAAPSRLAHSLGWRLRALVAAALLGCLGVFVLAQWVAGTPHIAAEWSVDAQRTVRLRSTDDRALKGFEGSVLKELRSGDRTLPADGLLLERSARWLSLDADRAAFLEGRRTLSDMMATGQVTLAFADGSQAYVHPERSGVGEWGRLGALFWLFALMGLLLYLLAMIVWWAAPTSCNLLYGFMALCQTGNLLLIAIESAAGFGLVGRFDIWDLHVRTAFDLASCAALAHAATLRPRRIPAGHRFAIAGWALAVVVLAAQVVGHVAASWWWTQIGCGLLALGATLLLGWSYKQEPHPMALVLRRLLVVAAGIWMLLTVAVAATDDAPGMQHGVASVGSMIWYVFAASLLALLPFLGQSKPVMREFALLAAVSTIATSLDLLFVAIFSLNQFASVTLALFVSVGLYVGVRQWLLSHVRGPSRISAERMFEQLYRTARAVEANPSQSIALLSQLLREVFEPLEVIPRGTPCGASRVEGDGSTLRVNVPSLHTGEAPWPSGSIIIRYAHRGRRLFTEEDARLTDSIVDQLRRAVAFDRAVEHGRSEERTRLAQDLHDDIGARLLTLMYKAHSPEMEDYVRHTLQDLKTLTRGLAASTHRLPDAAAEWKTDLTQRLSAARIALDWTLQGGDDIVLTVVQWSALTRILRELVSNIIAHAHPTTVDIALSFRHDRLDLVVKDDGEGRDPRAWAHGLGLGGIRKRARQLSGDVEWSELEGRGICCHVTIRQAWLKP